MLVNYTTNYEFVGDSFTLIPNTLKSTVYIGNWPFQKISNTLQIITDVKAGQVTERDGVSGNVSLLMHVKVIVIVIVIVIAMMVLTFLFF